MLLFSQLNLAKIIYKRAIIFGPVVLETIFVMMRWLRSVYACNHECLIDVYQRSKSLRRGCNAMINKYSR